MTRGGRLLQTIWLRNRQFQSIFRPSGGIDRAQIWNNILMTFDCSGVSFCVYFGSSMQAYDPMEILEPEFDDEGRDGLTLKANSLNWILENVSASSAAKSSQTALLIRQWLEICQRMRELSISIEDMRDLKNSVESAHSSNMTPIIQESPEDGFAVGAVDLPAWFMQRGYSTSRITAGCWRSCWWCRVF